MDADLSRLTPGERQVLALLAQGHTAKSVAALTGASLHSVNERLREARRKTGVGSSRELARRLAEGPQENRDEQIGVAQARPLAPADAGPDSGNANRTKDWIIMALIALTATSLAALFLARPAEAPKGPPHVVATTPADGASVAAGPVTISVTFDRPMRAGSYSFTSIDAAPYPDCARTPRQSADGRRFTLACRVVAGRRYGIGFNGGQFRNFVGLDGVPATPAALVFSAR